MSAAPAAGQPARQSVARRIVALFLLCGLLPVVAAIAVVYENVVDTLIEQRIALLRGAANNYGTLLVDRLANAERLAQAAAPRAAAGRLADEPVLRRHFLAAARLPADAAPVRLFGTPARVPAARGERLLLEGAGHVAVVRDGDAPPAVWMVMGEGGPDRVAFQLHPAFLWPREDARDGPIRICVLDAAGLPLDCPDGLAPAALASLRPAGTSQAAHSLAWDDGEEHHIAGARELFLAGRFGAEPWLVLASQPEDEALAPVRALAALAIPVALLGLLVAAFLGLVQVRRTLAPLRDLTQAAGRVAVRDFEVRVETPRDDEFAVLARSFNAMSARLGRQFKALLAQAEIDAVILSTADLGRIAEIALTRLAEMLSARHYGLLVAGTARADPYRLYRMRAGEKPQAEAVEPAEDELDRLRGAMRGLRFARAELEGSALAAVEGERLFVLPFSLAEELGGAIVLGFDEEGPPSAEEVSMMWKLGDRIAVALATARRDQELHRRAYYDSLTNLPNRALGVEELERAVAAAKRRRRALAVLFVDLDGFSDVNDTLGHSAGDMVLVEAAARLRGCLRKSDVVARLGGDEFAVMLPELRDPADAAVVAQHALTALAAPIELAEGTVHVTANVGIALYPGDGETAEKLLTHADLAMYHGKQAGRGRTTFFEASMNAELKRRVDIERELRVALQGEQFRLYYQPQLELSSGRIVGAEALLRWIHPERGLVPPVQFIGIAETSGLIEPIGQWALKAACAQLVAWRAEGLALDYVSVNVSPRQLNAAGFSQVAGEAIEAFRLAPAALHLEITESAVLDEQETVRANLAGLAALGIPVELDDFGTGYSSLGHLRTLRVSAIKLDRVFIKSIHESQSACTLARAAIEMAHALNKTVVAEGVELAEQLALLGEMGCDIVQGYHLSPPVPADQLAALVRQRVAVSSARG
jgi:diguanylate cyclase (GGDEF)-like protein